MNYGEVYTTKAMPSLSVINWWRGVVVSGVCRMNAMHTTKITPNLLFQYQCTIGKFIRLLNRIEKTDSVARIESN